MLISKAVHQLLLLGQMATAVKDRTSFKSLCLETASLSKKMENGEFICSKFTLGMQRKGARQAHSPLMKKLTNNSVMCVR